MLISEPEPSSERAALEKLNKRLGERNLDAQVRAELQKMTSEADPDAALAAAIRDADRVVLASNFVFGSVPATAPERKGSPMKSAIGVRSATDPPPASKAAPFTNYPERGDFPPLHATEETFPLPSLLAAASAVGHVNMIPESDGSTRYEALIVESRGYYYPSLAIEAIRVAAGLDPSARQVAFGDSIKLGDIVIPTDARSRVLIDYAGPQGTIPHISAADVLQGKGLERVKDRVVFIGATAEGLFDLRVTPFSPIMPGSREARQHGGEHPGAPIHRAPGVDRARRDGRHHRVPAAAGHRAARHAAGAEHRLHASGVGGPVRRGALRLPARAVDPARLPSLALVITFIAITVYRFLTEERQRQYTKRAFQQYVSPEVVEPGSCDNPEALQFGGELRNLTVLFSDIRDFTTFTEKNDPQLVVQMLREYLTEMTRIVIEEGGTLDKYIGDAVMAEFGAPIVYPDHALRGCRAALRMAAEVERLTAKWIAEGREPFRIGLGVNTGNMVVGNLGSEQLFDYTVIGDEVNLGARLESLNKDYQTDKHIIISDGTVRSRRRYDRGPRARRGEGEGKDPPGRGLRAAGAQDHAGRVAARGQATRRAATCRSNSSAAYRTARWGKCSARSSVVSRWSPKDTTSPSDHPRRYSRVARWEEPGCSPAPCPATCRCRCPRRRSSPCSESPGASAARPKRRPARWSPEWRCSTRSCSADCTAVGRLPIGVGCPGGLLPTCRTKFPPVTVTAWPPLVHERHPGGGRGLAGRGEDERQRLLGRWVVRQHDDGASDGGHAAGRRDVEVRLARADDRDGRLRHLRAHLAGHHVERRVAVTIGDVVVELGHGEARVLGDEDRAAVREDEIGRAARQRTDLVTLDQSGSDRSRRPGGLPLRHQVDAPGGAHELGTRRLHLRLGGAPGGEYQEPDESEDDRSGSHRVHDVVLGVINFHASFATIECINGSMNGQSDDRACTQ